MHAGVFHQAHAEQAADSYLACGRTDHGLETACFRQAGHVGSCVLPDPGGRTAQNPSGLLEIGFWPVSSKDGS